MKERGYRTTRAGGEFQEKTRSRPRAAATELTPGHEGTNSPLFLKERGYRTTRAGGEFLGKQDQSPRLGVIASELARLLIYQEPS